MGFISCADIGTVFGDPVAYIDILHYKACNVGAESTEIPVRNMSGAYTHIFTLHATGPQPFSTPLWHTTFKITSYIGVSPPCFKVD